MKENKLNILITGAYGFVGSNISAFLKKSVDCNLIALDINQGNGVYDEFVHLHVWVHAEKTAEFRDFCIELTNGKGIIAEQGLAYRTETV